MLKSKSQWVHEYQLLSAGHKDNEKGEKKNFFVLLMSTFYSISMQKKKLWMQLNLKVRQLHISKGFMFLVLGPKETAWS